MFNMCSLRIYLQYFCVLRGMGSKENEALTKMLAFVESKRREEHPLEPATGKNIQYNYQSND